MNDSKLDQIIKLAGDIDAGRSGNHASKAQWYTSLQKFAEAQRKPDESSQQSLARVIKDGDGRLLWRAYRAAGGADYAPPAPAPVQLVVKDSARIEIAKAADELIAANPDMSRSAALAKIWADRPELAARAKAEA